jgi:hypothetical protein
MTLTIFEHENENENENVVFFTHDLRFNFWQLGQVLFTRFYISVFRLSELNLKNAKSACYSNNKLLKETCKEFIFVKCPYFY